MFTKIYFKPKDGKNFRDVRIPIDQSQHLLNGFIHRMLGEDNRYHDGFSPYCISELQGMRLDKETRELYVDGDKAPYITVSAYGSQEILKDLIDGLYKTQGEFAGLVFDRVEVLSHCVNKTWDVVLTTSPILLIVDGKKISIEDDGFIGHLKEHCLKKLRHAGIEDETFDIQIRRPDRAKKRKKYVGDTWNICSVVSLYVTGRPVTREALYELGLGGSTGSGFGSVKVFS